PCISAGCNWFPGDTVTKPYCEPLASGKYCGNGACEFGETTTSCPADCKSFTGACYAKSTETECKSSGCTWYLNHHDGTHCDDAAHGQTTTKPQCSDGKDNDDDGLIDYPADKSCYSVTDGDEAYPPICTTASSCTTMDSCSASGFVWYNGLCRETQPKDGTCAYSYNYCINETECLGNKYYWCKDSCYGSSAACPTLTPTPTPTPTLTTATPTPTPTPTLTTTTDLHEDAAGLCSDGIDNDRDGFIDLADPSCASYTTTSTCSAKTDSASCTVTPGCAWAGTYCYVSGGGSTTTGGTCPAGQYWTGTACAINPSPTATTCPSDQYWNGTSCVANTTTTCITCSSPGSGCWYEGGSCSTCGTIKCSTTTTTTTTACNNNGVCDSGESSGSCPSDCQTTTTTSSCITCANPGSGCWYEGGSCSTCGTVKCSTTTTTTGGASVLQAFWNRLLGF
ncbi:MAG: hypothetical protein AAB522_02470, partial [Patescibacteria group bacterium]